MGQLWHLVLQYNSLDLFRYLFCAICLVKEDDQFLALVQALVDVVELAQMARIYLLAASADVNHWWQLEVTPHDL